MKHIFALSLLAFIILSISSDAEAQTKISQLRTEHLTNPQAVESDNPLFSWVMESKVKGQKQTAYQILAWTGKSELWNSGKIDSDQSLNIAYKGKNPGPGQKVSLLVKVWDKSGKSFSSDTSFFGTGLKTKDWKASWISMSTKKLENVKIEPAKSKWIWYPEPVDEKNEPQGTKYFKTEFNISDTSLFGKVTLFITSDDKSTIFINGKEVSDNKWMVIGQLPVKKFLVKGINTIEVNVFNKLGTAGLWAQLVLESKDKAEFIPTDKNWKVSKEDKKYVSAEEIADFGRGENKDWLTESYLLNSNVSPEPPAYLRKSFSVKKKIKSARLYATALGIYEIHLNGKKASNYYFAPGWTDYNKRLLYQAYDVTSLIREGENAIGAILADGWYVGTIGWGHQRNNYGIYPLKLKTQLQITYEDGSEENIVTDNSWRGSTGPITTADFLDGENYDARLEMKGWNEAGFNDQKWKNAEIQNIEKNLSADPGVPIQITETIKPKNISEVQTGTFIYDLGQNISGIVRLKVKGPAGTLVKIRFAEMLNKDGTIYTTNLRNAKATDTYILKGEGEEIFEPHFTFHGFRYVEITGFPGKPDTESITGLVIHSVTPKMGNFECSSPLVNQLYKNINWGQRDNFLSVPTDCPQRDERLGWMGDAQIFVRTASYNMDVQAFFDKWMNDVDDAQEPDGAYSNVAPRVMNLKNGAPAWGDAGVIVPYTIYQMYMDKKILSDHYEGMKKWCKYITDANPDLLWKNKRSSDYGDWLSIDADTDKEVLATAFYAYSTRLVAKSAAILNKPEDAKTFEDLFQKIKTAFIKNYVTSDGKVKGYTQTAYILSLSFDLLPEASRPLSAQILVDDIKAHNWHHTTGFIGIGHLMPVLTATGHLDVAYRLLNNTDFPSWGYMIKNGATTIWERWDGYTDEKGFQSPGMNSFNHYSLGSVGEWLYETVAGISPASPGFKTIKIAPQPGGGLTYANTEFNSPYGKIISDWKIENQKLKLKVGVPSNTTAEITYPGTNIKLPEGVKIIRKEVSKTLLSVEAGEYSFEGDYK